MNASNQGGDPDIRIIIQNGKNKTYRYKDDLKAFGFRWSPDPKKGLSNDTYALETKDRSLVKKAGRFCRKKGLRCKALEEGWVRNGFYRDTFFAANKPDRKGRYRCAYCGLKYRKIHVDHIVPVYAVENPLTRNRYIKSLKRRGIMDINASGNLTAACTRCNLRKGKKTGAWITRGRLGSKKYFWTLIHGLFFICLLVCCIYLVVYLQGTI